MKISKELGSKVQKAILTEMIATSGAAFLDHIITTSAAIVERDSCVDLWKGIVEILGNIPEEKIYKAYDKGKEEFDSFRKKEKERRESSLDLFRMNMEDKADD